MADLIYEKKTAKSLDAVIESLKDNLMKHSFGVLWEVNFKDKIEEKGLKFEDDFIVLEVCNPQQAKEVLDVNIHVGYVLPCKIVVRTNSNQTYIGMTNPSALIGLFDEKSLNKTAKAVAQTLKKAIDESI